MAFRVGQEIECIDDGPNDGTKPPLIKGAKYTVSHAVDYPFEMQGIDLVESPMPDTAGRFVLYNADRFRAIVKKSNDTGMAIFREILDRETIKDDKPIKVRSL